MSEESIFDAEKNYYFHEYVYDPVNENYTHIEGEIVGYGKGTDMFDALERAGLDDVNKYGAKQVEDLDKHTEAIAKERKHLSKISKQLKGMVTERDTEREEFLKERPCPNGCGKLDEKFRCDQCGYGRELEQTVADLDTLIEEQKANGEDTTELEKLRDDMQKTLDSEEDED